MPYAKQNTTNPNEKRGIELPSSLAERVDLSASLPSLFQSFYFQDILAISLPHHSKETPFDPIFQLCCNLVQMFFYLNWWNDRYNIHRLNSDTSLV